jgi:hypothetical protein
LLKDLVIVSVALLALSGPIQAKPLDTPTSGPKQLCFKYSIFSLNAGERVTDFSGSMEGLEVKIKGSSGTYEIAESEIFAPPKGEKTLVYSRARTKVYRVPGHGRQYEIEGPTSFSQGKDWPLIWLSGNALRSLKRDVGIFGRLEVRDPKPVKCEQTFTYGVKL